eukprot:1147374-Pelagomonas_calceolata.AAC.4
MAICNGHEGMPFLGILMLYMAILISAYEEGGCACSRQTQPELTNIEGRAHDVIQHLPLLEKAG